MTTAISTVSTVRIAAAAAGLAGALVLTACSGGDSKDDSSSTPSASATSAPTATASADSGGSTGSSPSAASDALQGSWLATTDGKAVALVVTGKQAALFTTGGSICSGTAGEEAGMQMIHLKCTDKSTTRATGMVGSVSKSGLSVTWSGSLGKETYTKAEGGKLPSGLPTAGLGS
ncbi:hypothetical protein SAMN05216489_04684 [Streptomyces sp. 3213]|uniref:hypothetical protein n=1 Tax=Streptomyces sp. 3213.3 TaxID=1855348 RepID=UPI00089A61E5|nr:hypothetical protein [Streptomyces sp. 3213.3]SED85655.1 hypothetical protein SAMN05216489_04684 [Streptomyces sp. 3213] [Streptomyces sp. 3213.3]